MGQPDAQEKTGVRGIIKQLQATQNCNSKDCDDILSNKAQIQCLYKYVLYSKGEKKPNVCSILCSRRRNKTEIHFIELLIHTR